MTFHSPTRWADALAVRAEHPQAVPIAGGTDAMVELNSGRRRPDRLLDLSRIAEVSGWDTDGGTVRAGAGITHTAIVAQLAESAPALAQAASTVGSPQIRNRATLGGNIATASPAGDTLPTLLACGAAVELHSVGGARTVALADFVTGPKRTQLAPDELIAAVLFPAATGPQHFSKVGVRAAMIIAVCSFAVALFPDRRSVGTGIGAAAPTPRAAVEAQDFAAEVLPWDSLGHLDPAVAGYFGDLVAKAADPIDDVRGTAQYRRHALAVIARRALIWAWDDLRGAVPCG
ncbi:FAD binding domain-containing protein [Micromonospora echinofusca]|uniref:Xanthine dehydrogenase family protein subunit M n=1 Tax=Micromonospora echinofusca TaxID=47858 RepID=A0ABS3VIT5_MICEH|nr:FAD binding domain-containing protein [Micromonospora echinofusca]MBO4204440.1 xanthine dehydrogenase family protein subunit M [Micromonospora echinofusca]